VKPIDFAEKNCTYAKDQPEYLPLPVYRSPESDGEVWSCWRLSFREKMKVLFTGKVWLACMTFHKPLQPVRVMIDSPFNPESWKRLSKEDEKKGTA